MPVIPALLSGILLGYLFIYFPVIVTASFLIILSFVFKNNKVFAILLSLSLISGILYVTQIRETTEPEDINFTGYLKNKNGNIYEFKVIKCDAEIEKTILKVYSRQPLNEGQTYKIECVMGKKPLNPYQYETPLCFLKNAQLIEQSYKTKLPIENNGLSDFREFLVTIPDERSVRQPQLFEPEG